MESVSTRPAVAAPPAPSPQDAKPAAAATELLPAKTVSPSEAGEAPRTTGRQADAEPRTARASKSVSLDAETQSVILKKTDTDTGELLAQYPNDAQLNQRAYARELTAEQPAFEAVA